jgi:cardiolipin synthase (CMP-forming)
MNDDKNTTPIMTGNDSSRTTIKPQDELFKNAIITLPNLICFARLAGSFVLLAFAVVGWRLAFVGLFVALSLSDWIDGKLARWLHQRSKFGASLDSFADAALYTGLIGGSLLLSWETLQHEFVWLAVGISSYVLTTGAGLWKYGRVPSYHTYGAKATQWLALMAGGLVVLGWSVWPLRFAVIAATLTNLEAIAITCVLKEWRTDVLTIFHVWPQDIHARVLKEKASKLS